MSPFWTETFVLSMPMASAIAMVASASSRDNPISETRVSDESAFPFFPMVAVIFSPGDFLAGGTTSADGFFPTTASAFAYSFDA